MNKLLAKFWTPEIWVLSYKEFLRGEKKQKIKKNIIVIETCNSLNQFADGIASWINCMGPQFSCNTLRAGEGGSRRRDRKSKEWRLAPFSSVAVVRLLFLGLSDLEASCFSQVLEAAMCAPAQGSLFLKTNPHHHHHPLGLMPYCCHLDIPGTFWSRGSCVFILHWMQIGYLVLVSAWRMRLDLVLLSSAVDWA